MTAFVAASLLVAVAVLVEIVLPGRALYHAGWYNVALAALVAVAVAGGRRAGRGGTRRARAAILATLAGTAVVGAAGIVNGLLAPDNQTIVGAPGQRVRVESLGTLAFPLSAASADGDAHVTLERPLHFPVSVGARSRDVGSFILRAIDRSVVAVEARDARGNRLTITQPTGSAFLSPVLLMQQRQTIAGMDLPYDSFDVPAARRVVKAVLFSAAQSALFVRGGAQIGEPSVLFAVDDENERPLPRAIGLSAGGRPVAAGGLILRGVVETFPAVEAFAVPNALATALGTLVLLGGLAGLLTRDDRAYVPQDDASLRELDAFGR